MSKGSPMASPKGLSGARVPLLQRAWNPVSSQDQPSREQVLAASAGWVAVVLNLVPGLGTGYLYQRRWKAYWITSVVSTLWFLLGVSLAGQADPLDPLAEQQNQLTGLIGLVVIAAISATEAGLTIRSLRCGE